MTAAAERAVAYSSSRVVFGGPIGRNQGVQFPIAKAHMAVEAADLMTAPVSNNLVLAYVGQHVLGMPRSY